MYYRKLFLSEPKTLLIYILAVYKGDVDTYFSHSYQYINQIGVLLLSFLLGPVWDLTILAQTNTVAAHTQCPQ